MKLRLRDGRPLSLSHNTWSFCSGWRVSGKLVGFDSRSVTSVLGRITGVFPTAWISPSRRRCWKRRAALTSLSAHLSAGTMRLCLGLCDQILSYRDEWREERGEQRGGRGRWKQRETEIEEGSCAGQNVSGGFESVYIRPLLCCSPECNMLNLVFTPASGVGCSLHTELWI